MAETDIRRGLQDFWGLLDDDQRQVICNRAIVQSYSKGESLYKVGEDSTYLVCVLTGHIKLERISAIAASLPGRIIRPRLLLWSPRRLHLSRWNW